MIFFRPPKSQGKLETQLEIRKSRRGRKKKKKKLREGIQMGITVCKKAGNDKMRGCEIERDTCGWLTEREFVK